MARLLIALTLAFAGGSAVAADGTTDPLQSPACRAALEALQAREAALDDARGAALDDLRAAAASSPAAAASAERPPPGAVAPRPREARVEPELQRLRDAAARACLASRLDAASAPPAGRMTQPPVALPSREGASRWPASPTVPVPVERPRPVVPSAPPPTVVTTCDAAGCWTSDGRRLERLAPNVFVGPRGVCTAQGAQLLCP